jgi:glycosyltransferase involved in cell wall biosynthesis
LRVIHIITGLSTGGAERALYNVLSGGLANRFDTAVISLRDEGTIGPRIKALGVPVYALNMRANIPSPKVIAHLRGIVRSFNPDVVQGWMYHGNLAASLAAAFAPQRPLVVWNVRHSLYGLEGEKFTTRQVIRGNRWLSCQADTVIYNSRVSRGQHEAFGFSSSQGMEIPNGFDMVRLKPDEAVCLSVRREFGIPNKALLIGHVARYHPMKDHASFLRAAVRVASETPNAHFLVVGREVSPENQALTGIVPPELIGRFFFPGEHSDVHQLMQAMDVLVMSSAWGEAFPNVLGEAMACGLPCVATNVGDSSDIVEDTGIVVPPSDSEELARGILTILEKPEEERRLMGRAARERVQENYSLTSVVEKYARLYERLNEKRR